MVLSKNIILPSCDHTFTNPCSSLAFSNILNLFAVKVSVTLIPFPFKRFLFLYIEFLVLYLANFTIIGRGLALIDFFGFPSLCELSMSSGLFFLIHMLFYYFYNGVFTFYFINSMNQKAVTPRILFLSV